MKKILVVIAAVCFGMASCKKEETIKPATLENQTMGGGTVKDMSGMD